MGLSTVLFFLILVVAIGGYLSVTEVDRRVWLLAGLAFALRVGFAIVNQVFGPIRRGDETAYHATLEFVTQQWQSGVIEAPLTIGIGPGHNGVFAQVYSVILGPVYALFGIDVLHARLAMAFFGTLVVVNLYLIGSEIYSRRGGLYAAAIATVFPYWIYLSGILYRDMLVVFFFTSMFYGVIRLQQKRVTVPLLTLVAVSGLFALGLRLVNLFAIAAAAAAFVYIRTEEGSTQRLRLVAVSLASFALFLSLFGDEMTVRELAGRRRWLARENTGSYLTEFAYESVPEMLTFLPIGTLYFTFVPFPWQTPNLLAILAVGQNLFFWYPIVLLSILGFRDAINAPLGWRKTLPLVAFACVGLVGYGLVEGNLGPALRHRAQFQFVFFVLAGIALSRRLRIRSEGGEDQGR